MNVKKILDAKSIEYHNPIYVIIKKFLSLYITVGFLLRIVLMLMTPDGSLTFGTIARALAVGVLSDAGVGLLLTIPLAVLYMGLNEVKYRKRVGLVILILLLAAFIYVMFFHSIFDEYGGGAPKVAKIFLGWKLASFALRYFMPKIRENWRRVSLYFAWGVYVFLFLVIAVGEIFFWQEFGVRYNFIAVDYLVYTHEVIGNIMESYAIVPIMICILILVAAIIILQSRHNRFKISHLYGPCLLSAHVGIYLAALAVGFGLTAFTHTLQSNNQYVTQLEQNGACDFVIAFHDNKLEYDKFYTMLPEKLCEENYRRESGLNASGMKVLGSDGKPDRCNIVLITVESLSGEFLTRYGNTEHLTPNLDRLMSKSLVFDNLYAAGNRTVRGLEALSLCVPPSAGESIIKRKENRMGSLSVGAVLKKQGYLPQFLYGGDSYFDNMGDYFSHNGYQVIDRSAFKSDEISFANIWGVCDGDMFNKSLKVFDADARTGKPFFAQIMTTSNHRPYTYPAGSIKVAGDPNTREATVKYTDYAIGKCLSDASRKSWFANTVFIIIADHCASSAGKTSIPVDKYHIPCIVYSPRHIHPEYVRTLCSQIDVMPTVMSLLHLNSKVRFAGQDVLAKNFYPRAFMATYQDLGYYEGNILTVLSPVRQIRQYKIGAMSKDGRIESPVSRLHPELVKRAQTYYQYVNMKL